MLLIYNEAWREKLKFLPQILDWIETWTLLLLLLDLVVLKPVSCSFKFYVWLLCPAGKINLIQSPGSLSDCSRVPNRVSSLFFFCCIYVTVSPLEVLPRPAAVKHPHSVTLASTSRHVWRWYEVLCSLIRAQKLLTLFRFVIVHVVSTCIRLCLRHQAFRLVCTRSGSFLPLVDEMSTPWCKVHAYWCLMRDQVR